MARVREFVRASTSEESSEAAAVLAPWPETGAALEAAELYLRNALGGADAATVERLGAVAAAMVEQYAPDAPQTLKNEAVIRFAGYLTEANYGAMQSQKVGDLEGSYVASHANAFRNCGAAALLSRWRVRRAGAIG